MVLTTRAIEQDGCVVVAVDGELDMSTAPALRDVLTTALVDRDIPLVLDLTDLRFCDSAGLAVFVQAHNELETRGCRLVIAGPSGMLTRVLELTGLDQVILTAADPAQACVLASTR